jgi:serine/threonine protein kinase
LLGNGKYSIDKKIGAGGFGITYRAHHSQLNTVYAIKEFFPSGRCARDTQRNTVIPQGITNETYEKYKKKFIEEAQMLASLNHPNIVKVIDVFEENNTSYIIMPFIQGNTVQQVVEQQGRMSYDYAVNFIAQLCDAVGYIHAHNILHRDIKPDNIIITPQNMTVLIDFGAARQFIQDQTQHHTTMLTPGYAPYEQYTATNHKGTYSDIYSIGATFYFMLTGQTPTDAPTRMLEAMPSPKNLNPEISDNVNIVILKAMNLKPADRYQQAKDLLNDLLDNVYIDKVLTFGRHIDNDIVISNDQLISRNHLQIIKYSNGRFAINDLNSTNGTYVNNVRITGEVELNTNDIVKIGNTVLPWLLYFNNAIAAQSAQVDSSYNNADAIVMQQSTQTTFENGVQNIQKRTGFGWYKKVWKQYADFSGRARRREYWYFALFNMITMILLLIAGIIIGSIIAEQYDSMEYYYDYYNNYYNYAEYIMTSITVIMSIYGLIVFLPALAVTVRRLHDSGKSGWWLLINLIPYAGSIVIFIFTLLDSQPNANEYGASPKENNSFNINSKS